MNVMKKTLAARIRRIAHRTYGKNHGFATRLMSPSDLGEILKAFVFLDLFDHEGERFSAPLHPHSGIATLTYVAEGAVSYIDPDNVKGTLAAGGVEWMQAGRGMWHGGGLDKAGRTRGFQLWIALPPELELGPTVSIYQAPEDVPQDGPARVLLGSYRSASSAIASPSRITYLPLRIGTISAWGRTPATRRRARFAMPRRTFRRSGRASFRKAVCKRTPRITARAMTLGHGLEIIEAPARAPDGEIRQHFGPGGSTSIVSFPY